jgi:hypothetical protein
MEALVVRLPGWSDFRGENLSPADWRGGDGGFDFVYFLEVTPWKSSDQLQLWRNGLVREWRFVWSMGGDEV